MPLALLLLAGFAGLFPARWNSGDLKSLELLESGPVNCILVQPKNWNPALWSAAKRQRIAVFGVGPDGVD